MKLQRKSEVEDDPSDWKTGELSQQPPQWPPFSATIGAGPCLFYCVCLCNVAFVLSGRVVVRGGVCVCMWGGLSRLNFTSEDEDDGW